MQLHPFFIDSPQKVPKKFPKSPTFFIRFRSLYFCGMVRLMSATNGKEPTGKRIYWLRFAPSNLNIQKMNINELLSSGANVAITITPTDLKEFALYLIDETLSARHQDSKPETYLTPDEVASKLNVSKNTLWRWNRCDYLNPVRIGRKTLYKASDIASLLSDQQGTNKPVTGRVTGKSGGN